MLWIIGLLVFSTFVFVFVRYANWLKAFMSSDPTRPHWAIVWEELVAVIVLGAGTVAATLIVLDSESYSFETKKWAMLAAGFVLGALMWRPAATLSDSVNRLIRGGCLVLIAVGCVVLLSPSSPNIAQSVAAGIVGLALGYLLPKPVL